MDKNDVAERKREAEKEEMRSRRLYRRGIRLFVVAILAGLLWWLIAAGILQLW